MRIPKYESYRIYSVIKYYNKLKIYKIYIIHCTLYNVHCIMLIRLYTFVCLCITYL